MTILAVDLGTSAIKFLRANHDLTVHDIDRVPASGLDVEIWLDTLRQNIAAHDDREAIDTIAITGQMHGLVTMETDGRGPGIPWTDQRGASIAATLNEESGAHVVRLGGPLASGFLGVSLAWIRMNDPARWSRVRRVMLPKDALIHALTGRHVTDPTDAAGTGLFDVEAGTWDTHVIDHIAVPEEWLPEIIPSGSVVGSILPDIARNLGLSPRTRVVIAGGDAPVGAFGSGVHDDGGALLLLSSGAQIILPTHTFAPDPQGRWYTWPSVDRHFLQVGTLLNAGNTLAWARDVLCDTRRHVAPAPTSLIALPHLIGERTPIQDSNLRGALLGLSAATTAADIHQALLEGVAYSIRHALDIMSNGTSRPKTIRIGGGGANIVGWQQIITDVLNIPTRRIGTADLTALGAAALAAGKPALPVLDSERLPNAARSRHYAMRYELFRDATEATRSISHRLAALQHADAS